MTMNRMLRNAWIVVAVVLVVPAGLLAQETNQAPDEGTDDGRINFNYWMDGMGLYCVGGADQISTSVTGGGLLLLLDGTEILFVPESAIRSGIAQAEVTGLFATLGVAAEDVYFYPPPALYVLPNGILQANVAKSSPDDRREGKIYEFQFEACRGTEERIVDQLKNDAAGIPLAEVDLAAVEDAAPVVEAEPTVTEAETAPVVEAAAPVAEDTPIDEAAAPVIEAALATAVPTAVPTTAPVTAAQGRNFSGDNIPPASEIRIGDVINGLVVVGVDGDQIFVVAP